jgi:hypothetical protein
MFKKTIIASIFVCALCIIPALAQAQTVTQIVDTESKTASGIIKYKTGDYDLNDLVLVMVNASKYILGVVGSLALIMFVYGGFMFLISGGSSDKINKAKTILIAAVIGLVIVFASYLIIKFVLQAIGINWEGTNAEIQQVSRQTIMS